MEIMSPIVIESSRHRPKRTCVGCRQVDAQARLLRAVKDAAGCVRFDTGCHRSPGRGCYTHRTTACIKAAVRGGFERSLKQRLRLTEDEIQAALAMSEKI